MKDVPVKTIGLICAAFIIILIRDFTVYPEYSWGQALLTTSIRVAVLFFTVYLSRLFRQAAWKRRGLAILHLILWVCIIPHSFYNITQVRHISEICRLPERAFFAGQCNGMLWSILPLLIYSVGSLLVFLYSVDQVANKIAKPYQTFFFISVFAYVSLGAVIGIYSRIDTIFSIFLDVRANFALLGSVMSAPDFWYNVLAYFVFAVLAYGARSFVKSVAVHESDTASKA